MFESEYAHECFCCLLGIRRPRPIICSVAWSPHPSCKLQCFPDFQRREVNIFFGAVYDITTVPFVDIFRGQRVVENISLNVVVLSAMVGERFQKGAASRTRTTEDNCVSFRVSARMESENKAYIRSISPGRTTPSKSEMMLRSGGWRKVSTYLMIDRG